MKQFFLWQLFIFIGLLPMGGRTQSFMIERNNSLGPSIVDGRLLLLISNESGREPRFQTSDGPQSQLVFGMNVMQWKAGESRQVDSQAFGYPLQNLADLPAGEYWVQAILHRYETFHRQDGHIITLPMDRGEGQQWNQAPGNWLCESRKIILNHGTEYPVKLVLDIEIPPIDPPEDTAYIKHIRISNDRLSRFWGRPMELGAVVLLPEGYETHPEIHYPLLIHHGHFQSTIRGFRDHPPDPGAAGRVQRVQEYGYSFYRQWTDPDFPRAIVVIPQHACPYYDDSYAVNSANVGPYGDAITYDLIPYIEKTFRCIGKPWARGLFGGSTGGWISLAAQVFYPDEYGGCWAGCPDPVDFRGYQIVNIYDHRNAYFVDSPWKRTPRLGQRNWLGESHSTMEEQNHRELALGDHGRSGGQWDIWQAVFSPVGEDGYPQPIWDKRTGSIDHEVAEYWKDHYDLRYILQRDWKTLGPKLVNKIHVMVGDMDSFHLNNAVYWLEEFLESTTDPYYAGEIIYGDRKEHCWSGIEDDPVSGQRLPYPIHFTKLITRYMAEHAPEGADMSSWQVGTKSSVQR